MMASRGSSRATRETTSDSAKTVQTLEMETSRWAAEANRPSSPTSVPSRAAMTSRNRPVPAAHLSFI